jgi:hypothetical protein
LEALCSQLASVHGISQEEVRGLLECTLSETLTHAMHQKFIVTFDGKQLHIYQGEGSQGNEGLMEFSPGKIRREVIRLFRYRLDTELKRRKALAEHEYLRLLRGRVLRGTIDRVLENGNLSVLVVVEEMFSCRELRGTCTVANQPVHERGNYRKGGIHFFFVSSVRLVPEGRLLRNEISLSRTTPRLTEALLIKKTGHNGIKCVRRIAGKISHVVSAERIPREAIVAIGTELGERIHVTWKSSESISTKEQVQSLTPTWV